MRPSRGQQSLPQIASLTPASYVSEDSVSHRKNLISTRCEIILTAENIKPTYRLTIIRCFTVLFVSTTHRHYCLLIKVLKGYQCCPVTRLNIYSIVHLFAYSSYLLVNLQLFCKIKTMYNQRYIVQP